MHQKRIIATATHATHINTPRCTHKNRQCAGDGDFTQPLTLKRPTTNHLPLRGTRAH